MKILVINAGSNSLKYQLINVSNGDVMAKGLCERIGILGSVFIHKVNGKAYEVKQPMADHGVALQLVLNALMDENIGVIKSINEIDGFGHRFLHGGPKFIEPTLVTAKELEELKEFIELGPLHMPANISGVEACMQIAPNIPNVAVFDTSFHSTIPEKACVYAIPYEFYEKYNVKRYGFHGMSHDYVSQEIAREMGTTRKKLRIITCHIGNGASVAAVNKGVCVDTSMGFTPLEGLVMGSRSGDMDPAIVQYMMNKKGWTIEEAINCLNKQSGLQGVSGYRDMRDVEENYDKEERCKLAIDMYVYRIKKYIGAYAAAMGGVDAIVFTAGAGENGWKFREKVMENMEYLGINFDKKANRNFKRGVNWRISKPASAVAVYVIPTNEELVIAKATQKLIK